jgi:hypothetical protein
MMRVDLRIHPGIREQVHAGIAAIRVQGRQTWDRADAPTVEGFGGEEDLKSLLGSTLFATIIAIDDLGLDPIECLEAAIVAREKESGR